MAKKSSRKSDRLSLLSSELTKKSQEDAGNDRDSEPNEKRRKSQPKSKTNKAGSCTFADKATSNRKRSRNEVKTKIVNKDNQDLNRKGTDISKINNEEKSLLNESVQGYKSVRSKVKNDFTQGQKVDNEDFQPGEKRRKGQRKVKTVNAKKPTTGIREKHSSCKKEVKTDEDYSSEIKISEIENIEQTSKQPITDVQNVKLSLQSFKSEDLTQLIKPKRSVERETPKKVKHIDKDNDIHAMLLKFEKKDDSVEHDVIKAVKSSAHIVEGSDGSSEESDWEEVADLPTELHQLQSQLPDEPVEITLQAPDIMKKKKKKKFDMQEWYRLQVNKFKRSTQAGVHKVHLLCLVAHGIWRNRVCEMSLLQACALSQIPSDFLAVAPSKWSLTGLTTFTHWFRNKYKLVKKNENQNKDVIEILKDSFQSSQVNCRTHMVYLYLTSLRVLGLDARLIMSLQPVCYKAKDLKSKTGETIQHKEEASTSKRKRKIETEQDSSKPVISKNISTKLQKITGSSSKTNCNSEKTATESEMLSPYFSEDSSKKEYNTKEDQKGKKRKEVKSSNKNKGDKKAMEENKNTSDKCLKNNKTERDNNKKQTSSRDMPVKKLSRRRSASKLQSYKELSEGSSEDNDDEQSKKKDKSKRKGKQLKVKSKRTENKRNSETDLEESGSDGEFEPEEITFRSPKSKMKKAKPTTPIKIVSSDSEESVVCVTDKDTNTWVEVFLENEDQWICVDCLTPSINKPGEIEGNATQSVKYILAFCSDDYVKDITKKYVKNWLSYTRKLRIEDEWWEETLNCYSPPTSDKCKKEDLLVEANLMKQPLPTVIGEFKNHPLYALKRHLLKFEAIYPSDAPPLGFVRGEPVYARECVHVLHSRENWLKEARLARIGEDAYKWVKARPKRNRPTGNKDEATLALFGYWQTEDYIPPPAVNGKVPRNEYGNVELFKPSMLPGGTVHLQGLPGLNRVAKKLSLDCVAAMTGWDQHSGYAHPTFDGWVVCEEHKDTLLAAWDEQQEIDREREAEKREKRVFDNWRKLIRGLLIKQKLQKKYNLVDPNKEKASKSSSKNGKSQDSGTSSVKATDTAMSWPLNRQEEQKQTQQQENSKLKKKKAQEKAPLFPFEMETM